MAVSAESADRPKSAADGGGQPHCNGIPEYDARCAGSHMGAADFRRRPARHQAGDGNNAVVGPPGPRRAASLCGVFGVVSSNAKVSKKGARMARRW